MSTFETMLNRVQDATLRGGALVGGNRDQIKEHLNEAIQAVDLMLRPQLFSSLEVVTAGQQDYSIANDFGLTDLTSIRDIVYTSISGSQPWTLQETTASNIRALRQNFINSTYINLYALDGLDTLLVYPITQNVGDTITIYYVPRPIPLVADSDVPSGLPPEFHELYELFAIQQAMRPQSPEYAMQYAQWFDKKLDDYRRWRNRRGSASGRQAIVGRNGAWRLRPHDNSTDWRY